MDAADVPTFENGQCTPVYESGRWNLKGDKNCGGSSDNSREAAKECSPRRKPWVSGRFCLSPEGAK